MRKKSITINNFTDKISRKIRFYDKMDLLKIIKLQDRLKFDKDT